MVQTFMIPEGEYVSVMGAAEILGVKRTRINQLITQGRLKPIKFGTVFLIRLDNLAEYRLQRMERAQAALDHAVGVGNG